MSPTGTSRSIGGTIAPMPLLRLRRLLRDGRYRRNAALCGHRALRRRAFARARERDQGAVVFAGDSLTESWATLARDFGGLPVANRGIKGDDSRGLLLRFEEDVLSCRPRTVVILIGTNDLSSATAPRRVAAAVRRMVDKAEARGVPTVLCLLLPRSPRPGRFPERIREVNALIDRLARGRARVRVCDSFTPLADAAGGCRPGAFRDGLHLNASGYAVLRAALAPHLPSSA